MSTQSKPANENDFAALLAESEAAETGQRSVNVGDVVSGRVIAIGQNSAFVAIGGKGEAVIDLNDFRDSESGAVTLAVGDNLEATVTDDGKRSGAVVLKRSLGRGGHVPGELEQAYDNGIPVEGVVTGENKGGFDVQLGAARAFCPGSQIDRRRTEGAQYVGQRLQFRITKIDNGGRNIVVSRRLLLDEEAAALAEATWERIQVGAVLSGTISSLRDFGAFVDLGGVDGLVHVSELGYGRVKHPSEAVSVGQVVDVQVIKVSEPRPDGRRQIGLSLRALAQDPWATASERFTVGTTVSGKVSRLEAFGAFVELAPGLEGLVHVSKLTLDRRVSHPRQVASEGAVVEVTVLSLDTEKRRIGLSMVENARVAQENSRTAGRIEEQAAMAQTNEGTNLGTFADLLSSSRSKSE